MLPELNKIKGIHPGAVLKRELVLRQVKSIDLANSIQEFPQTINAITQEKRGINPKLSIKLGQYFKVEEDYFMILQASFEVQSCVQKCPVNALKSKIRPALFWDTDFGKLDTFKYKRFIIQRIFERGNCEEIQYIIELYGRDIIEEEIKHITRSFHPDFRKNVSKFL